MKLVARIRAAVLRRRYKWFHRRHAVVDSPSGMVSFTFDDFLASAADTAAPMLVEHGWRGTFYLSPGLLTSGESVGEVCSQADVERLHQEGHEIGNHTYSHKECTNVSKSVLLDEFNRSQQHLTQFTGARHFSFPCGEYDTRALTFFGRRFNTLRTVDPGVNSGTIDLNRLKANPIYESLDPHKLQALLKQTRDERGWLILYTHDVCATPSKFGCTVQRFASVISAVKEAGLAVHTVGDAYRSSMLARSPKQHKGR